MGSNAGRNKGASHKLISIELAPLKGKVIGYFNLMPSQLRLPREMKPPRRCHLSFKIL